MPEYVREFIELRFAGTSKSTGKKWFTEASRFNGDPGTVMAALARMGKRSRPVKAEYRTVRVTEWRDTIEED